MYTLKSFILIYLFIFTFFFFFFYFFFFFFFLFFFFFFFFKKIKIKLKFSIVTNILFIYNGNINNYKKLHFQKKYYYSINRSKCIINVIKFEKTKIHVDITKKNEIIYIYISKE